jgi:hypothetical protein
MIEKVHREKEIASAIPSFYIAFDFLNHVCAMNLFSRLNLNWHSLEAHVHVYH